VPRSRSAALAPQFDDPLQQREAATLGMWVFLATEILLFGGLFAGLTAYRTMYLPAFEAASHHLELWNGTLNTAVLLTSSLTMALAVRSAQLGAKKPTALLLLGTAGLGAVFLGFKLLEYYHHYQHGLVPGAMFRYEGPYPDQVQLFFVFYYVMTGLHAVHLTIGLGVTLTLAALAWLGRYSRAYHTPVEMGGLYWHLIDVVWVFLYPMLYLIGHR
jgi:cytochrome c oxidase subunit 3